MYFPDFISRACKLYRKLMKNKTAHIKIVSPTDSHRFWCVSSSFYSVAFMFSFITFFIVFFYNIFCGKWHFLNYIYTFLQAGSLLQIFGQKGEKRLIWVLTLSVNCHFFYTFQITYIDKNKNKDFTYTPKEKKAFLLWPSHVTHSYSLRMRCHFDFGLVSIYSQVTYFRAS